MATTSRPVFAVVTAFILVSLLGGEAAYANKSEEVLVSWTPSDTKGLSLRPADTPTPGCLLTWWMGFKTAVITETASGITFTQNPHTATVPPIPATPLAAPATLDHVKHLAFSQPFAASDTRKLSFSVRIAAQAFAPSALPYKVINPRDDIRLGSCTINFIDWSTMIVADTFLTNKGVWALYERLPFARTADNVYGAFSLLKRISGRVSPSQVHDLQIKYDQKNNYLEWWVDGKIKHKVSKIGYKASNMLTMIDLGGKEQEVVLPSLSAGVGCFTLLDFTDPNASRGKATPGLLNLNPTDPSSPREVYVAPTSFQMDTRTNKSAIADPRWRLFGQGTSVTVSAFKIAYE